MILKFSNELDCEENNLCKKNLDLDRCCKCLKMRRNMMNLLLRNELQSEEEFFNRANSQKNADIAKKSKKDKNGNKNEEISKNQHDIKYINLNSNEEKNKINEDYLKEKNEIGKINENNNNIEISINTKEEIKIEEFNENINIEEQKSDNKLQKEDEINLKKKNSIDLNIDNIKNEIKLNDSDNNVKSISNNDIANFLGIGNNMNISPLNQLETFIIANEKLVDNEDINSLFSGSTCVSVIYTPEKLIVPNIGDSRAVLGRLINKEKNEYKAIDLSRDHKPTEKDEAQRIIENDGRIQPFTEEGEFVGPQRVWIKEEEVPGLAMTRSFGDRVAATVGVMSEPEIKEFLFDEGDKFMIIASDGIWEFISSQECVDIIKDFYDKNDLKGCCEYLYQESSKRWLKEEEVIDDTTLILVFFE